MPTLQTFDGPTLEDVLSRVGTALGPEAQIVRAGKVRRGGVAGFFAKESFEVVVEVGDDDAGLPRTAPVPPPASVPRSIVDLVEQVSDEERGSVAAPRRAPLACDLPATFSPSTEGLTFQEVLRGLLADTVPPAAPAASPVAVDLARLGVPEELLAGTPAHPSAAQALLAGLERLPQPAPLGGGAGEVVVVVGDAAVAAEAAAWAAAELGHVPVEVVAGGAEEAAAQGRAWRERLVPTVAVLGAGYDAASVAQVRSLLAVLAPTAVWGAVRADRKPDDVMAWTGALAAVTALAVGACGDTTTPGSSLGVGLPVAVVDGRRSTPAAWTALLVERLAAV